MKLLVFDLDRSFGPIVVGVFDVGERDDYNVVAMGLAYDRAAILVLRHCQLGTHKIITYWTEIDAENDSGTRFFLQHTQIFQVFVSEASDSNPLESSLGNSFNY